MVALSSFSEHKVGVLSSESGCDGESVQPVEVFGKEVDFVLSLMEYFPSEVFVCRAVAVCGIRYTCCEPGMFPSSYVVGFNGIGLVTVFDVCVYVGEGECGILKLFYIVGVSVTEIQGAFEIDHEYLLATEVLFEICRQCRSNSFVSMGVGK